MSALQSSVALGLERQTCEVPPEQKCDFVCDCSDCSDELDCGKRPRLVPELKKIHFCPKTSCGHTKCNCELGCSKIRPIALLHTLIECVDDVC